MTLKRLSVAAWLAVLASLSVLAGLALAEQPSQDHPVPRTQAPRQELRSSHSLILPLLSARELRSGWER